MDLLSLNRNIGKLVYDENINGSQIEVRELNHFRWFSFGDDAIQAVIDVTQPSNILLPVPQAMLSFLLWKIQPLKILNLGVGGGCFERYFQPIVDITLQSVEMNTQVIDMARTYFSLPKNQLVYIESAEDFLQNNQQKFDVILCDIFTNQENPACLYDQHFYENLYNGCSTSTVVFINLFAMNEQDMVEIIKLIKPYFNYVSLIEFKDYKNVILVISPQILPDKALLLSKNNAGSNTTGIDFSDVITHWHVIS